MNTKGWNIKLCIDSDWLLVKVIKLWKDSKEDNSKAPMLFIRELKWVPPQLITNKVENLKNIECLISHWKCLSKEDSSNKYCQKHAYLNYYWKGIHNYCLESRY